MNKDRERDHRVFREGRKKLGIGSPTGEKAVCLFEEWKSKIDLAEKKMKEATEENFWRRNPEGQRSEVTCTVYGPTETLGVGGRNFTMGKRRGGNPPKKYTDRNRSMSKKQGGRRKKSYKAHV